jgi:hypothetical protein
MNIMSHERGRILMDIGFLRSSKREIKNMNKGKVGAPFEYSHTYVHTYPVSSVSQDWI